MARQAKIHHEQCTVCASNQRFAADAALLAEVSIRDVAARFGFTASSVGRHKLHASGARRAKGLVDQTRDLFSLPPARADRSAALAGQLDLIADDAAEPPLVRHLASVRNAADLRSALQLLLTEAGSVYHEAKQRNNLNASSAALKQCGWLALVLAKAHGWIVAEQTGPNQTVNLFGELDKASLLALRDALAPVVVGASTIEGEQAGPQASEGIPPR